MFILPGCPHCKLALRYQEELLQEHPEWQTIPLRIVGREQGAAFADEHDYYYVPTCYVDGQKVFEATRKSRMWSGCSGRRRRDDRFPLLCNTYLTPLCLIP